MLSNLVGNAVKHGAAGGVIEVRLDGTGPDFVTMQVKNQGTISAEILPFLFDPFRAGLTRHSDGLGLWLYIVEQVAKAHGGKVEASSDVRAGTLFEVLLPRANPPETRFASEATSA